MRGTQAVLVLSLEHDFIPWLRCCIHTVVHYLSCACVKRYGRSAHFHKILSYPAKVRWWRILAPDTYIHTRACQIYRSTAPTVYRRCALLPGDSGKPTWTAACTHEKAERAGLVGFGKSYSANVMFTARPDMSTYSFLLCKFTARTSA